MLIRKTAIMLAMAFLVSQILFAQSRPITGRRSPPAKPIVAISHPTKVIGEGTLTPSGVRYWDIRIGEGNPATKGHAVKVLYKAWVENGKEFASSISDGRAPIFTLGVGQVILGWEEGIEGMKVGGTRQLRIPPELAYGVAGIPRLVPPNATLIFDVELIELQ